MSRKENTPRKHTGAIVTLTILMIALIAGSGWLFWMCLNVASAPVELTPSGDTIQLPTAPSTEATTEATTEPTLPEPEHVVSTATITSTGDVLMHMPVVDTGLQNDGSYNFDSIFRYVGDYTEKTDFAVANLETTLASTDNGYPYHGYPNFNCPDAIVTAAKDAGFDMFLTANNHSYDTGIVGYKRTLDVIRGAGMDTLGTMSTAEEPKYIIKEINGIKIGMLCYTYAYSVNDKGCPSLNGMPHISEPGLCNYFHADSMDQFYTEVDTYLQEMKEPGAEATMMFIHWGVEYQTYANDSQKEISQRLCDLGIDVIVGGHPHVVQPVSLLTSTVDEDHKTVCLYSMGNAVSNQRQGNISYISTAHTEDGVLFSVTFSKYSDGTVQLEGVDLIPCWVNRHSTYGRMEYNILPLDPETREQWQELYGLSDMALTSAGKSFDRTMAIVGEGLQMAKDFLAQRKADLEQYFYDLVFNPDKIAQQEASEAAEATAETTLPEETQDAA